MPSLPAQRQLYLDAVNAITLQMEKIADEYDLWRILARQFCDWGRYAIEWMESTDELPTRYLKLFDAAMLYARDKAAIEYLSRPNEGILHMRMMCRSLGQIHIDCHKAEHARVKKLFVAWALANNISSRWYTGTKANECKECHGSLAVWADEKHRKMKECESCKSSCLNRRDRGKLIRNPTTVESKKKTYE